MPDVAVIGAGMAGVTAAREVARAGLDVVVVESQHRVGGRIQTDYEFCGLPVERGAEFIHTMDADTWPEVRAAGFDVRPCDPTTSFWMSMGGKSMDELWDDPGVVMTASVLEDVPAWDAPDMSAAAYLDGKGFAGLGRELADTTLTLHPAGDLDEVGMAGLRDDRVVELELGIDHRLDAGYEKLPQWIAEGLDVRLGWRVETVAWGPSSVTLRSTGGEEVTASACVCTLPVGVLKAGSVRFEPELPPSKRSALGGLEMGAVVKVLYRFDDVFWPPDAAMLGCDGPVRLYWPPLFGLEGDVPAVLTAYVTGWRAKKLSGMSEDEAVHVGLDDLSRLFPGADPRARLVAAERVDWPTNEHTRGGYSFVRVGGAGSRAALAAPDTGALFWAGDGTATTTIAAVVHAAYATGRRAAGEVQARLA